MYLPVKCRCTLSKSLCVVCGHGAESSYWIIEDQAFSPSSDFVAPSPCPPIRQKALRATHRKIKKKRQLAAERGGCTEQFFKMVNMVYYFMYRRPTLCTLNIAVDFLKSLKIAVVFWGGGCYWDIVHILYPCR